MSLAASTASLTAQNTFCSAVELRNDFNVSISGTWSGTITLQRSFDDGSTWLDVKTYTANAEEKGFEPEAGVTYQLGFETGNYTSGTAAVRLSA